MSKQKIFLYTSDIAAFIGQNKYDFVTPLERLWKRCDVDCYNKIINKSKTDLTVDQLKISELDNESVTLKDDLESKRITKRQYNSKLKTIQNEKALIQESIEKLESRIDDIDLNQKQKLEKLIGKENTTVLESKSVDTNNKKEEIDNILQKMQISDEKKVIIKRETENFINKTHGTLKEETAIDAYERRFDVKLDVSQQLFKVYLETISKSSSYDWYICGKVDGLYKDPENDDNNYIV